MTIRFKTIIFTTFLVLFLFIYTTVSEGVMFCNMDDAGGDKAKDAKEKSAKASAAFLMAASKAYEMFSELELFSVGERTNLNGAVQYCQASLVKLNEAKTAFSELMNDGRSISAIDDYLSTIRRFDLIFSEAYIDKQDIIVQSLMKAFEAKKTRGVIVFSIRAIEEIQGIMNGILDVIGSNRIPRPQSLWIASYEWNLAFTKGRVISSLFTVRNK
jgi:hypothetical protein